MQPKLTPPPRTTLKLLSLVVSAFAFTCITLTSCKKDLKQPETVVRTKTTKFETLTAGVLSLAKNKAFMALVFNECAKQKYGDYYVRLEELFSSPHMTKFASQTQITSLLSTVRELKASGYRNPILFYPSVETKTQRVNRRTDGTQNEFVEPIGVIDDPRNPDPNPNHYLNYEYPGYRFGATGNLDYAMQVNEEYAWEYDVWVIGEEEDCSPENMVDGDAGGSTPNGRVDGQYEVGGLIQVTDIKSLESWTRGKLELKYFVMSEKIAKPKEKAFGKRARSNFKDDKWHDFNDFIAYWNVATIGNYMIEGWIEEDGGSTTTINQNFPAPCTGCASTSVSYSVKSEDDNMGQTLIQFTDPMNTIYGISYANIKRKL